MRYRKGKKLIAGLILGAGIGMLSILILPPKIWLFIISMGLIIIGIRKIFER